MERIGIIMDNSIEMVECIIEIWNSGNSVVIIDFRTPLQQIIKTMKEIDVKKCYVDTALCKDKIHLIENIDIIQIEITKEIVRIPKSVYKKYVYNTSHNEAIVLFSSGTTGDIKGTILSHAAITGNANAIIDYMKLTSEDRLYIIKSLAHSSTLVGELLVGLISQISVFIGKTQNIFERHLKNIVKFEITTICMNPTLLHLFKYQIINNKAEQKRLSLNKIVISGSVCNVDDINSVSKLLKETKIINVYGLTEAGPRVSAQNDNSPIGSVGKAIKGVDICIRNEDNKQIENNCVGIIYVKSDYMFTNYTNKHNTYIDNMGWLNTRDVGYLDSEGNLFVLGRKDEMIITGSHNVLPNTIESLILKNPNVTECIIIGIDDCVLNKRIVCLYVSKNDICEELRRYCQKFLPVYEIPKEFVKILKVPKTATGKKMIKKAEELYYQINEEKKHEK